MRQAGHQEAVILFNADEEIAAEMSMQTFAAHLAGAPMGLPSLKQAIVSSQMA